MSETIVITGLARTPMAAFMGEFSPLSASDLGAAAVRAALVDSGISPDDPDKIIMGCVLPAGQGQAPARQAGMKAGLDLSCAATTVNKMCGSAMQAAILGHDMLKAGSADLVIAGGMESMTGAPYVLPKARSGYRMGNGVMIDTMMYDGLTDAYDGKPMGVYADMIAREYQISREEQDAFAIESVTRARRAAREGDFEREITPVTVPNRKGDIVVREDAGPKNARPEKIPTLRPVFSKDGTVTAANASSINDGAAALVLMRESEAKARGVPVLARIVAHAAHAHEPQYFTTAPVGAINKVLEKAGWSAEEVDLWEINEAFAVVTMIAMRDLGLDHNKVNVNGGACVLGHPIGAS
ncbi:MAG TPA: acetyl-CoA C-acyltransferase, partial [Hellea balneolensis]|nr:acetyl-CoA C-acyltransferase [Hellea balneolensis]